jgi:hypothetical protein
MWHRLLNRLADWMCDRLGLVICFDGDLMTPDCPEDAPDPHYRPQPRPVRRTR